MPKQRRLKPARFSPDHRPEVRAIITSAMAPPIFVWWPGGALSKVRRRRYKRDLAQRYFAIRAAQFRPIRDNSRPFAGHHSYSRTLDKQSRIVYNSSLYRRSLTTHSVHPSRYTRRDRRARGRIQKARQSSPDFWDAKMAVVPKMQIRVSDTFVRSCNELPAVAIGLTMTFGMTPPLLQFVPQSQKSQNSKVFSSQ